MDLAGVFALPSDRVSSPSEKSRTGGSMPGRSRACIAAQTRLAGALVAAALLLAPAAGWAESAAKTLRFIPQADLRSIDPIWTTAYVTRNFGYLVFDTLFALDKDFKPQPQMVDRWTASDDKLSYSFVLRDGLKWHDGQPVRAADCIASVGKVAKVDRVEWLYIPDTSTAAAALNAGEADWYEQPPADLVPVFAASKDITVTTVDPLGNHGILRFNHVQPPFNNLKLRQAVLNLVDQKDYMGAAAGDPKYWKTCAALFGCGTPFETNTGADALLNGPNLSKATQLIQEAGYKGEKIVLLSATDQPIVQGQALVTLDALRKAGLNVELQANDWGTLITRRTSKEPVEKGGWSIFHTWTSAPDFLFPAQNLIRANGEKAWFGWPTDPKIEELIDAWFKAPDLAAQKKL